MCQRVPALFRHASGKHIYDSWSEIFLPGWGEIASGCISAGWLGILHLLLLSPISRENFLRWMVPTSIQETPVVSFSSRRMFVKERIRDHLLVNSKAPFQSSGGGFSEKFRDISNSIKVVVLSGCSFKQASNSLIATS